MKTSQLICRAKTAMSKDNQESIPLQLTNKNIFSKEQEGSHYRFDHMIISSFKKYIRSTEITIADTALKFHHQQMILLR